MADPTPKLTMLGTGHAAVSRCFNTCFVISTPKSALLTDCGSGSAVLGAISRSDLKLSDIHHLFITHAHIDHFWGALPLIVQVLSDSKRHRYQGTLTVCSHQGVLAKLEALLRIMLKKSDLQRLDGILRLQVLEDGQEAKFDDLSLKAFDIGSNHEKQFGYVLTLPGGLRLACLGDEPFYERCRPYVQGCDYLLCEAFCLKSMAEQYNPYRIHHSTAADAARTAQGLKVKNLVLYHTEDDHLPRRQELYAAEAKEHFEGKIYVPYDLETIELA